MQRGSGWVVFGSRLEARQDPGGRLPVGTGAAVSVSGDTGFWESARWWCDEACEAVELQLGSSRSAAIAAAVERSVKGTSETGASIMQADA
ncbi:hypothetical protein GCM10023196_036740 [Actinoallomurus vinaceus]|uniref:Uncharacterized protein n=1 Tax=Actinoallomurus vinaceus TaxID=1080074 RepID=A0ABP8UDT5_9ACTN